MRCMVVFQSAKANTSRICQEILQIMFEKGMHAQRVILQKLNFILETYH